MKIGIVIAMPEELEPYKSHIETVETYYGKRFNKGQIGGNDIVICLSGIGKVNAAFATTLMVEKYNPELIISTGVSGGLGQKQPMDIVVADKIIQHDVDTTALGDPIGMISSINKVYFETSKAYSQKIYDNLEKASMGTMACGDQFIATKKNAQRIVETFGAIACDMESGAIAQVAYMTDTDFVVVRGISDSADENAAMDFQELTKKISNITYNAVKKVIEKL